MEFHLDQIKELLSGLKEKGVGYAGTAVDRTKDAARIARVSVELGSEKEALKKAFVELGKAYYEEYRGTAEGLFSQLCEEVDAIQTRIDAMQAEIDALKGGFRPERGPDLESVVAAGEAGADIEVEITQEPDGEE